MNHKNLKKGLALLTTFLLLLSFCVPAFAATGVDLTGATVFTFSDGAITVTEGDYTGYKIEGTALTVNKSGVYVLTGACSDGSVKVKKGTTGVTLVLSGLTLSSSDTAPVTCNKQTEVVIFSAEGTVNTLTDSAYNNDENYPENENAENAVIKAKDGSVVTLAGTGTINVVSNGKNGVKGGYDLYEEDEDGNVTDTLLATASLTVRDLTLNVTANAGDGVKSDKELNILSGNITVSAIDDGVKSDYVLNIGQTGTAGPAITVAKSAEGIEGATINVWSGTVKVNATDDGINAANSDLTNYSFSYNQYGGRVWVNVTNGDGVDANGSVNLNGGTLEVYTPSQGDGDPLDADAGAAFNGATVLGVGNNMMAPRYSGTASYVTFGGRTGGFGGQSSTLVAANATVSITDANGSVLYTANAVRNAGYVVFSSADLTSGETYSLVVNGKTVATATAGANGNPGSQGGFPGGQGGFPGGQGGNQPGGPGGGRPDFPRRGLKGDVDLDGSVTAADARLALRLAVALDTAESGSPAFVAADVNLDGVVTAEDARLILRAAVGPETL